MNYLSNVLPLNGRTPAEISDALPSYFTPADYAFSIWGLIYMALLGFVIYQALPAQRHNPYLKRIGYLFALTCLENTGWLLAWHYGFYSLSVLVMISLLVTLIAIYLRLGIGRAITGKQPAPKTADQGLVLLPFRLYLGWITVATIANIASVLNHLGWSGWGIAGPTWSAIMMLVATALTAVILFSRTDLVYAGVVVWALLAIRANHAEVGIVANTAALSAAIVLVLMVVNWFRSRRKHSLRPVLA